MTVKPYLRNLEEFQRLNFIVEGVNFMNLAELAFSSLPSARNLGLSLQNRFSFETLQIPPHYPIILRKASTTCGSKCLPACSRI